MRFLSFGALVLALPLAAPAQNCLTTTFAGTTSTSQGCAALLDITVSNPILIQSIDCNFTAAAGVPVTLDVYTTPGTWVGNETNMAVWTLVGQDNGTVVSAGGGQPTTFVFATPILLQPGTYGLSLDCGGATSHRYSSATSQAVYSDANISLTLGAIQATPFTSGLLNPRHWNGTICYQLGNGLFPGFTATPTSGPSPLQVQFTDTSYSSAPGGITNWAWDLDGDGQIDSNAQNPQFTYTTGGKYSVTLTVVDGTFGGRQLTKTDYIVADPIAASFSVTPPAGAIPLQVQFTDTTTGNPIAWQWDLDGDGNVDSTQQNPTWTYTMPGRYTVSLTVTNGANVDSKTIADAVVALGPTNNTASAELLEFQFNETTGSRVANAASTTAAPSHALVTEAATSANLVAGWQVDPGRGTWNGNDPGTGALATNDIAPYARVDTGWQIDITGSHSIAFWCRTTGNGTFSYAFGSGPGGDSGRCYHAGTYLSLRSWGNLSSFVDSATDPDTLIGWNHWCVVIDDGTGTGQWYLNGVPDGAPLAFTPNTFTYQSNGNFTIGNYTTTTSAFTRYFDMDDFRVYARALTQAEIVAIAASENPAATTFGDACVGPAGAPTIRAIGGAPALGNAGFGVVVENMQAGVPQALNVGLFTSAVGLPFDLGIILPATHGGCFAQVYPDMLGIGLGGSTAGLVPMPVPVSATLVGNHLICQGLILGNPGAITELLDVNVQN